MLMWTPRKYGEAYAVYNTDTENPENQIELPVSGDAQNDAGEVYATVLNSGNARHVDAAALPGYVGIYLSEDQDDEEETEGDELDD